MTKHEPFIFRKEHKRPLQHRYQCKVVVGVVIYKHTLNYFSCFFEQRVVAQWLNASLVIKKTWVQILVLEQKVFSNHILMMKGYLCHHISVEFGR